MPSSIIRAGVALALALAPVVAVSEPAAAADPSPVSVADVATRHFGDGGPAVEALVRAGASAQLPDRTKVFWDQGAFSIRRVDADGTVSTLAGTGREPGSAQTCRIDTGADARQVPLAHISGLWGDVAGNLYAWPGYQQRCGGYGDVYRLDATDHRWHVVVANGETQSGFGPSGGYQSVAVSPDGSVYVSDAFHHVVRRLGGDGSDVSGRGVIVAGTLDSPGSGGDGGPATAAQVNRPVLAATGTALFLSDGPTVRRVRYADGVIETVAGTGEQPPADAPGADDGLGATKARVSARALAVSPDGTTVYVASPALDVRAFSPGGGIRTVVSPSAAPSGPGGTFCAFPDLAGATQGGHDVVVLGCLGTLRMWAADGAPQPAGTPLAGLDDRDGAPRSPDGVPLSRAFLPGLNDIAVAPSGQVALATTHGVRTVASLEPSAALGTLTTGVTTQVAYAADGTLYASLGRGLEQDPYRLVVVSADGSTRTVLGGGSQPLAAGAGSAEVSLDAHPSFAIDSSGSRALVVAADALWSVPLGGGTVSLLANGARGLTEPRAVAWEPTTGQVYVSQHDYPATIARIDPDGAVRQLGGIRATNGSFDVLSSGGLVLGDDVVHVTAAGGSTTLTPLPGVSAGVRAVFPGSRLLLGGADQNGGLLRLTAPITVDPASMPAAQVAATGGVGRLTVTVTPPQVPGLHVTVVATDASDQARFVMIGTRIDEFDTDGSATPRVLTLTRLAPPGTEGPVLEPGRTYRISVFTEGRTPAGVQWSAPTQSAVATPTADRTAPSAPTGLNVVNVGPTEVRYRLTAPPEADLDRVVVRVAPGTVAPSGPTAGRAVADVHRAGGALRPGQVLTGTFGPASSPLDPMKPYAFSAFAMDATGNVSATSARVVRPAAAQSATDPAPVTDLNWDYSRTAPGQLRVRWRGTAWNAAIVPGTTQPRTPPTTHVGTDTSNTDHYNAPVVGRQYSVSVFRWNSSFTRFSRTSATFTAGTSSKDAVALSAPAAVAYGGRPTLTATVSRAVSGSTARTSQSGVPVELWAQPSGARAATRVASGRTGSRGTVSWTRPAATVPTTFQVRVPAQSSVYPEVVRSAPRLVAVKFVVRASLSASRTLTSVTVRRGARVDVHVRMTPARATKVVVQRYSGGRWRNLTTRTTSTKGTSTYTFRPASRGSTRLRVVAPAARTLAQGTSTTLIVTSH